MTDLKFAARGYTVDVPDTSPVQHITVTADAGVVWDAMTQSAVCQGFLPESPVFYGQVGNEYFYSTPAGMVEMLMGVNACTLMYTGT